MMQFRTLLEVLLDDEVEFILIGGVAGIIHGSARATGDLDVVYNRTKDNIAKIVSALAPYEPYLRGAPVGLPFIWDEATLRNSTNLTLTTTLGDLDFLAEVTGGGSYQNLLPLSEEFFIFDKACRVVNLETLINLKRAAGRPKDLEAIAELNKMLKKQS
jgi:predicted nucleotidyltransferase